MIMRDIKEIRDDSERPQNSPKVKDHMRLSFQGPLNKSESSQSSEKNAISHQVQSLPNALRKYRIRQKLYKRLIELTPAILSRAQRENWEQDDHRGRLDNVWRISVLSSQLIEYQKYFAIFSRKRWDAILEVCSLDCKKADKILVEQKKILDCVQERTDSPQIEQKTLGAIEKVSRRLFKEIATHVNLTTSLMDYLGPQWQQKEWEEEFQKEEKYPKILDQLRQTRRGMSQEVLGMQKGNLEILADDYEKVLADITMKTQNLKQDENDSRLKLDKALEEFCSDLTNPHLSPANYAKRLNMLKKWYNNLYGLNKLNPSSQDYEAKLESIEKLEQAYNDWTSSNTGRFNWRNLWM
jgi:hypothetical protein